jgi:mitochondrial import inner membrane translocase subunit TIM13
MDLQLRNLNASQKDELMDTVKQQIAVANAQELLTVMLLAKSHFCITFLQVSILYLQKMTEKCFKKCIGKPGTVLDSSEQVIYVRSILIM